MDRAEFNQMMGEAEAEAPSSEWKPAPQEPAEIPLWARANVIHWYTPGGVMIGFDLGDSVTDQPLLTMTPPGQPTFAVGAFKEWTIAVAFLSHLFSMFPQSATEEWTAQAEWVQAVHAEALRREVAARDAREANGG